MIGYSFENPKDFIINKNLLMVHYFKINGTVFTETTPFLISPKGERLRGSCPLGGRMGRGFIHLYQIDKLP